MRVLITGGRGQLAADLAGAFASDDLYVPGRSELDISGLPQVDGALREVRPHVVLNTAAFHDVDRCQSEPELSFAVNAAAPQRLAAVSLAVGALLVHFSSDYVFDGVKAHPYEETDPVNPLSVYGASKAAGEMAIRATTDRHLIVRTSGLYGKRGRATGRGNFVETILRRAQEGHRLEVVTDHILTPSATGDVATVVAQLVREGATGTFHITNAGECSWFDFAAAALRLGQVRAELIPTTMAARPTPARRPAYSVLAHRRLLDLGLPDLRDWQDALAAYMEARD